MTNTPHVQRADSIVAIDLGESPVELIITDSPFQKGDPQKSFFSKNQSKQELNILDSQIVELTESINIEDENLADDKN